MRTWIITAAAVAAFAMPAAAQDCSERIDEVAAQLEETMGLAEEDREAVLASLDAARIADAEGNAEACEAQVEAAQQSLEEASAGGEGAGGSDQ